MLSLIGLVIFLAVSTDPTSLSVKRPGSPAVGFYTVVRVNDGDTLVVDMDGHNETVRFIGVDTPETHDPDKPVQCGGPEASDYTKNKVEQSDSQVRLEADPINTNRDRYDRLLRYVYLKDGTMLNSQLIKDGKGFAYTSFPFEKSTEFSSLGEAAKSQGLGVWGSCAVFINQYGSYESSP